MVQPPHLPDRSAGARQRTRRRSVTKMLESDSLARPNWDEHARTSLQDLKPEDVLHHTDSKDVARALHEDQQENVEMPDCELQDPSSKFIGRSHAIVDRQKQLRVESKQLLATPMSQERRLTVMYEDEPPDEKGPTTSDSDTAASVVQ